MRSGDVQPGTDSADNQQRLGDSGNALLHHVVISKLDDAKIDELIKAVLTDKKKLTVKVHASDTKANEKLGADLTGAVKAKKLDADMLKKLVAKKYDELSDEQKAACKHFSKPLRNTLNITATTKNTPPPPPPKGKTFNLLKIDDASATFDMIKSSDSAGLSVITEENETPNELLKKELFKAVQDKTLTLKIFTKLVTDPTTLTAKEADKIVGDELRSAFGLPRKVTTPPPHVPATVNLATIDKTSEEEIKAAFGLLTGAAPVKIHGAKGELADTLKNELIAAVTNKYDFFKKLITRAYPLTPEEETAVDAWSDALKKEFGVPSKAPPGGPRKSTDKVIDLDQIKTDDQDIRVAYNLLLAANTSKFSVIAAAGQDPNDELKNELIDGVRNKNLSETLFTKMVKNNSFDLADYNVLDTLGASVKSHFKFKSKADYLAGKSTEFNTAYAAFDTAFKAICAKYEGGTDPIATELGELTAKFDAAKAVTSLIKPEDVAEQAKKDFVKNCSAPDFLERLYFSEFKPKFENAIKALRATGINEVKRYWGIMEKCCKSIRTYEYGATVNDVPEVTLRLATFGSAADWAAIPDKDVLLKIMRAIPDDVKQALLALSHSQEIYKRYFEAKPENLAKEEECIKRTAAVYTEVEGYKSFPFPTDKASQDSLDAITAKIGQLTTDCPEVVLAAQLIPPAIKKAETDKNKICQGYVLTLNNTIGHFLDGSVNELSDVTPHYEALNTECSAITPKPLELNSTLVDLIKAKFNEILDATFKLAKLQNNHLESLKKSFEAVRKADATFKQGKTGQDLLCKRLYNQLQDSITSITPGSTPKIKDQWNNSKLCCGDKYILVNNSLLDYLRGLIDGEFTDVTKITDAKIDVILNWIQCCKTLDPINSYSHISSKDSLLGYVAYKRYTAEYNTVKNALTTNYFKDGGQVTNLRNLIIQLLKYSAHVTEDMLENEEQKNILKFLKPHAAAGKNEDVVIKQIITVSYLENMRKSFRDYNGIDEPLKTLFEMFKTYCPEVLRQEFETDDWDGLKSDLQLRKALNIYRNSNNLNNLESLLNVLEKNWFKVYSDVKFEYKRALKALKTESTLLTEYFTQFDDKVTREKIGDLIYRLYKYNETTPPMTVLIIL